jgi:predicted permease
MMRDVLQIVIGKLLIHPLAVITMIMLLPAIDPKLQMSAVIYACVPMLSIYPIFGQRYHQEDLCAAALMVATTASFFTTTLWLAAATRIFLP